MPIISSKCGIGLKMIQKFENFQYLVFRFQPFGKQMHRFIVNWYKSIQSLERAPQNSWLIVFTIRLDGILSRFWIKIWVQVLNWFQIIDFDDINEYIGSTTKSTEQIKKGGFAQKYLNQFYVESKSDDEIDVEIYKQLCKLDSKLGKTASERLRLCLQHTTRSDIIKV